MLQQCNCNTFCMKTPNTDQQFMGLLELYPLGNKHKLVSRQVMKQSINFAYNRQPNYLYSFMIFLNVTTVIEEGRWGGVTLHYLHQRQMQWSTTVCHMSIEESVILNISKTYKKSFKKQLKRLFLTTDQQNQQGEEGFWHFLYSIDGQMNKNVFF